MFENKALISVENWPIAVICVGMLAAAIIDWWKFKVPNKLTFPIIIAGWVLGLVNAVTYNPETATGIGGAGGVGSAILGTILGCALLIPVYAIGGMGAGDVKMTMGFGSWIGAFYGFGTANEIDAPYIIFWAFLSGVIVGGVIGLGMILVRGRFEDNAKHLKEIIGDMFKAPVTAMHDNANARRPRWHRLPYGVPLCIGFLGYLAYMYNFNILMVP